jgi:hypothetical protein
MYSIRLTVYLLVLLLSVSFLPGCNKNTQVKGTVKFSDGEVLNTGSIYFENSEISGRGDIHSDGHFTVGLLKETDGMPAGSYKVYLMGPTDSHSISKVAPNFASLSTTPLTVDVTAGKTNQFDIVVERNPNAKK